MIGVDVAEIARFAKHVDNSRFQKKILTEKEQALFHRRPKAENLAAFFAVKEASSKALGTGIGRINWRDIELSHTPLGQPWAVIHDRKNHTRHRVAVSITHDAGLVVATAMLAGTVSAQEEAAVRELRGLLGHRPADLHKGTAGKALVIGGKAGMTGSISLAAQAALRAGAGYSYAAVRPEVFSLVQQKLLEPIVLPFLTEDLSELLTHADAMDAVGIGPGLGTDARAARLVLQLLARPGCPLVVDADALTILSKNLDWLRNRKRAVVLTPHGGERKRLLQADSAGSPAAFAQKYGIILIEKGPGTKIHASKTYHNPSGNPGLATAGTGDVLTGVVTGLLAGGMAPEDAARLGVYLHGAAGDLARDELGDTGLIASDLLTRIPLARRRLKEEEYGFREYMGGNRSGPDRKEFSGD